MKKGYLYVVLSALLFSTMEIVLKTVSGQFHPIQLTLLRFLIGGLFLIPFALSTCRKKNRFPDSKSIGYMAFLSVIGVVISMCLYQLAVENAQASVVAVLFSSNPVCVTVFSYFLIHETIHKKNVLALVLDILGILVIINPFHTDISPAGITLTLLSTVFFALYGVLGKNKCKEFGGVVVTCISFLWGSLILLLLCLLGKLAPIAAAYSALGLDLFAYAPIVSGITLQNLPMLLYISFGVTGGGYAFYFMAMEETSANTASITFFLKPILAPILAVLLIQEVVSPLRVFGIFLILLGSMASLWPTKPERILP